MPKYGPRQILISIESPFSRNNRQGSILYMVRGSSDKKFKNLTRDLLRPRFVLYLKNICNSHLVGQSLEEDGPRAAGDTALVRGSEHCRALSASKPRGSGG
jgi:hypothetical protein